MGHPTCRGRRWLLAGIIGCPGHCPWTAPSLRADMHEPLPPPHVHVSIHSRFFQSRFPPESVGLLAGPFWLASRALPSLCRRHYVSARPSGCREGNMLRTGILMHSK